MSVDIRFARFQSSSNPSLQVKSDGQMQVERENFKRMQVENEENDFIGGIFEILRTIKDPEHPYTLEQLDVINLNDIEVTEKKGKKYVTIYWKPSVPTCAYTVHIGLAILVKLERIFGSTNNLKIKLFMKPGTHKQTKIIDKQLNDKERMAAAKENENLMASIEALIS